MMIRLGINNLYLSDKGNCAAPREKFESSNAVCIVQIRRTYKWGQIIWDDFYLSVTTFCQ